MRFPPRQTHRLTSLFGLGILLVILAGAASAAYVPPPPDPPEIKAFAAQLVAAPDDAARDRLLAAAPAPVARDPHLPHAFNRAYGPLIYAGEYDRAAGLSHYGGHLAETLGDRSEAAVAVWYMGNIEGSRGDNAAALAKFQACRKLFEEMGDKDHLAGFATAV